MTSRRDSADGAIRSLQAGRTVQRAPETSVIMALIYPIVNRAEAIVWLVAGTGKVDGFDGFGLRWIEADDRAANRKLDTLDIRLLRLPAIEHSLGVVRLDPALQNPRGHRQVHGVLFNPLEMLKRLCGGDTEISAGRIKRDRAVVVADQSAARFLRTDASAYDVHAT